MRRAELMLVAILATAGFAAPPAADKVAEGNGRVHRPQREYLFVSGDHISIANADSTADEVAEIKFDGQDPFEQSVNNLVNGKSRRKSLYVRRGFHGSATIRMLDAKDRHVRSEIRARILPPAGSPETGPVLRASRKWDRSLLAEQGRGTGKAMHRRGMLNSMFRLSKAAEGGSACLRDYAEILRAAQDSLEASRATLDANPLLLASVHYHYQLPGDTGVSAGEFNRMSLFRDSIPTNRMTLLFRNEFLMSNSEDPIVRVDVVQSGRSTSLYDGQNLEMWFNRAGVNEFKVNMVYASGKISQQPLSVQVGSVLTPAAKKQLAEQKDVAYSARPVQVIFADHAESSTEGEER